MQQFTEIFTEEGRKNVRIKHVVPGQVPRMHTTPGLQRAQQQVIDDFTIKVVFVHGSGFNERHARAFI